jgi:hypothetical protein
MKAKCVPCEFATGVLIILTWAGNVARTGRRGMSRGYWWERQKERYPRPRRRWMYNIKMDNRDRMG